MRNNIIASIRILQMLINSEAFESWLKNYHNKVLDPKIFQGYKFFIECAFSELFDYLASEETFGIEEDFLFQRAVGETVFIEQLPNTCERVIFLKNIYLAYKPVSKAKNSSDLNKSMLNFQDHILTLFDTLIEKNYRFNSTPKLTSDRILQLILIKNLYIHFSQMNNNGPVAYCGSLMKQFWLDKNRLEISFEGYKYTLEYIWFNVVGTKIFNSTSLKDIHTANSWKKYTYIEKEQSEQSEYDFLFGKSFDLNTQTSLDSYFYRIQEELIRPLEKEHKISIVDMNKLISFNKDEYSKNIFAKLLSKDQLHENKPSFEENLDMLFYWYPIEVFQSGQMHNGIPAFITLLAGTVALIGNEKKFIKVMVRKFIHPLDEVRNDYSYSIFIDSQVSTGHGYSGWLLYFDCCGDHSGFSGSEYKRAEEIIEKYKGVIELKFLSIEKGTFRDYIAKYISSEEDSIYKEEEVKEQLNDISKEKVENTKLGNARGLILELITYYIHSQKIKTDSVKWNTEKSEGEIDVIIESKESVTIIECKVTPDNCHLEEEYQKAIEKLNKSEWSNKNKRFEFWFWREPNHYNKNWLIENDINYTVLSNNNTKNDLLKGFDIGGLKHVFGDI